ncbi:MAG TPA: hypothetical protein VMH81_18415, partial [Bryobacteraceae bacterium]|nr:hypothetical protein [Bryobacteraceae bacterium]
RNQCLYCAALAASFLATNLMAQSLPPVAIAVPLSAQETMTTGMVGITLSQTARLNVLNLNPVPVSTNLPALPANCNVEMQFVDTKNNVLKQNTVANFAPQTATSLDLNAATTNISGPTAQRSQIRGVVIVNPPTTSTTPSAPGRCSVAVTLEVFDNTSGSTVSLPTDVHVIGVSGILPLVINTGNRD